LHIFTFVSVISTYVCMYIYIYKFIYIYLFIFGLGVLLENILSWSDMCQRILTASVNSFLKSF